MDTESNVETANTPTLTTIQFATAKQLASEFSVHPKTIMRWVKAGKLPSVKINRQTLFFRTQLEKHFAKEAKRQEVAQ